jgi:anti-sigma B factor antagonist
MTLGNGAASMRYEFENGAAEVRRDSDATRIVLTGDLDMSTAPRARAIVEAACAGRPGTVVLDLSAIDFVDSHGFQLLAATHQALTDDGCALVLIPPHGPVRRVFEITGFDHLFAKALAE